MGKKIDEVTFNVACLSVSNGQVYLQLVVLDFHTQPFLEKERNVTVLWKSKKKKNLTQFYSNREKSDHTLILVWLFCVDRKWYFNGN